MRFPDRNLPGSRQRIPPAFSRWLLNSYQEMQLELRQNEGPLAEWASFAIKVISGCGEPELIAVTRCDLPTTAETLLKAYVKAYVESRRGRENCKSRFIGQGDLDQDGFDDLAVSFSVEGACNEPELLDRPPVPASSGLRLTICNILRK